MVSQNYYLKRESIKKFCHQHFEIRIDIFNLVKNSEQTWKLSNS